MTYVKINGTLYPAAIRSGVQDPQWDRRETKIISCEMTHSDAASLFVDDVVWSFVQEDMDEEGNPTQSEYDFSDYCVAGDITDHRDGTVTVKMGKATDLEEAYELLYGGDEI